jgi:hypothetical protein
VKRYFGEAARKERAERNEAIWAQLEKGATLHATGEKFGLTPTRVYQIHRALCHKKGMAWRRRKAHSR